METIPSIKTDIVIIGGGIAGLFTLNRLRALGYSVVLLESNALGAGQTIKSQGIIHGGIKFALQGILNSSANAVQSMPSRWQACLEGSGEIDLKEANILSKDQILWSTGNLGSDLSGFFAGLALNSRIKKLRASEFPTPLQNTLFKGQVWRLEEWVLEIPSLIKALTSTLQPCLIKIDGDYGCVPLNSPLTAVQIRSKGKRVNLFANHFLLTAGAGNAQFKGLLPELPPMQTRPLHMVMVKLKQSLPLYGHCIGQGATPRITITSHISKAGDMIWYLGGQLAESGVQRNTDEQLHFAKAELNTLFPWIDFSQAQCSSFLVDRAEPRQPGGKRPDSAFLQTHGTLSTAWPTKLALAPMLADKFIKVLNKLNIVPEHNQDELTKTHDLILNQVEQPKIATPVWDEA